MRSLFILKITIPVFLLCMMPGAAQPVLADEAASVDDFLACRSVKGKAERLLCYDTIADGGVFNQEKLEQVQRETFGSKEKAPEISVDQLTVTVVRVQEGANGIHYFHTADGQAWRQADPGRYSKEVPFEAEIKSGMMGSFFLVNEKGRGERVERVR